MKRKIAVKSSSVPARSLVWPALLLWLYVEHIGAPGWAYCVLWTVVGLAVFN